MASLLRWQLGTHYHLEEEVSVGQKPLQIDLLLLRKKEGELPEYAVRVLAGLVDYLNEVTLIEFKSPSDELRLGDFHTFLAYALHYRAQNEPLLPADKLHLLVVAPRLTTAYRDEMQALAVTAEEEQPGIWSLRGCVGNHRAWVLETAVLAGLDHPLLTLFSPQLLKQGQQTYAQLHAAGYTELVVYLTQQIEQYKERGQESAMQHYGSEEEMMQALADVVATLPLEKRLAGLSTEERLRGLPAEERLRGLPPEELVRVLSPAERDRLRLLLQQPQSREGEDSSPK